MNTTHCVDCGEEFAVPGLADDADLPPVCTPCYLKRVRAALLHAPRENAEPTEIPLTPTRPAG